MHLTYKRFSYDYMHIEASLLIGGNCFYIGQSGNVPIGRRVKAKATDLDPTSLVRISSVDPASVWRTVRGSLSATQ